MICRTRRQKLVFGKHFEDVEYVKCDVTPTVCQKAGVTGVPVWDIRGKRVIGYNTMPQLVRAFEE